MNAKGVPRSRRGIYGAAGFGLRECEQVDANARLELGKSSRTRPRRREREEERRELGVRTFGLRERVGGTRMRREISGQ